MRQHLIAIARGESHSPLKFRESDYFKEIVEPYNSAMEKLRSDQPRA